MKTRTLLIIILIAYYTISSAQNYKSIFSQDTTRWNVYKCKPGAGITMTFYSHSDTVINLKSYHKIYGEFIFSPEQPIGQGNVCGFVHEDTINGKYWFLKFDDNEYTEGLFMDLSLNKGDTFILISDFRFMWEDSIIVDSVYMDGSKRVIELNTTHSDCFDDIKLRFIEGVGASNGFYMAEVNEQPYPYSLICKYNDDTLLFYRIK
jgi:hypothetical protein